MSGTQAGKNLFYRFEKFEVPTVSSRRVSNSLNIVNIDNFFL